MPIEIKINADNGDKLRQELISLLALVTKDPVRDAPVSVPAQQNEDKAAKKTDKKPKVTTDAVVKIETVRLKLATLNKSGKVDEVLGLLAKYDSATPPRLSNVKPADYAAIMREADKIT